MLAGIATLTEALEMCWKGSGIPAKEMAGRLGLGYGHFMRMFHQHDQLHFPPELIVPLMIECKSVLPLEWLAYQMGYSLHEKTMSDVLRAIRDALQRNGQWVDFLVRDSGLVEPDLGRTS